MAKKASENFKLYQNPNGPDITTVSRPIIEADGLYFKDIDGSGTVSAVNDWRLPSAERAAAYVKQMTDLFDAWIYDDARIPTEISSTAVKTTYGYHVMFYENHGEDANWVKEAKTAISNKDYENWYKAEFTACEIDTVNDYWSKIN